MSAAPPLPEYGPPAGFWHRSAAWTIDAALVAPLAWLLAWPWIAAPAHAWAGQVQALLWHTGQLMGEAIIDGTPLPLVATTLLGDPVMQDLILAVQSSSWSVAWPLLLAFALLGAAYHVACECSRHRAGIGKRLLGLRACDRDGRRLGVGRALARYFSGTLSWATFNIGHLMALAGPDHLALHDRCSGTRVESIDATPATLPGWARIWLAVLALAGFGAIAWLANAASAVMRTALEQTLF